MSVLTAFVRFSRLHTVIGTTLSILALFLIAGSYQPTVGAYPVPLLLWTLASCLAANIFIVGLNQVTDVEIDRINKPYLPLASGAFSMQTGYRIIGAAIILAIGIAVFLGPFLLATVLLSLLLGTLYSLPPARLKRYPFWAAFCIIAVRGLIVNVLLFLHFFTEIHGVFALPPLIIALTASIFIFGLIIAWFKDMPDTAGDAAYEIRTLSIRLGVRWVFRSGNTLLVVLFLVLALLPWVRPLEANAWLFSGSHLAMLGLLAWGMSQTDLKQQASIARFYQLVWGLFFAEYAAFALSSLLGPGAIG